MNNKVIFIIVDALSFRASERMGYMMHLAEQKKAFFCKVRAELPTLSRPLYEVLLTGTPCYENNITNNMIVRRSTEESIFELARKNGLKTAAAAYYWISELYNSAPFNHIKDREQKDKTKNIQYGKFYFEDTYPDSHLFLDGEILRKEYDPDFLLIHPMGMDFAGHQFGGKSKEYYESALRMDFILGMFIPTWEKLGYKIIVTADHGMHELGLHGGIDESEREIPLWAIGTDINIENSDKPLEQLQVAPFICKTLGIQPSEKMVKCIV